MPNNAKITDAQVVAMRELRAKSLADGKPIDWPELAKLFGVHPKSAYRLCLGMIREKCGGPIEERQIPELVREFIRCRCCGGMIPKQEPCRHCQSGWERLLLKVLQTARVVKHVREDRANSLYDPDDPHDAHTIGNLMIKRNKGAVTCELD